MQRGSRDERVPRVLVLPDAHELLELILSTLPPTGAHDVRVRVRRIQVGDGDVLPRLA